LAVLPTSRICSAADRSHLGAGCGEGRLFTVHVREHLARAEGTATLPGVFVRVHGQAVR